MARRAPDPAGVREIDGGGRQGNAALDRRRVQRRAMRAYLGLGAALALVLFCFGAAANELRVTIEGVSSSSGTLMVGLYDSEDHFRSAIANAANLGLLTDRSRLVGIAMRAVAGTQSVVFTNLKPGPYAVIAFHDENDDGKLDVNSWGVPIEGYGFSNNAEGFLAAPSFKKAAIMLESPDRAITLTLKYPRNHPSEKPAIR
jgi:uncharacterized protein (DUF2141 family)